METSIEVYKREWNTVKDLLYTHPEAQIRLDDRANCDECAKTHRESGWI